MLLAIWQIIKGFWWLWALLAIVVIVRISFEVLLPSFMDKWRIKRGFAKGAQWRSDRQLLHELRGMTPNEFEEHIADLFSKMGFKTTVTGGPNDGGVDVIAEKNNIKHYIQCKKYITSEVSVGAMRDFYGAIADRVANGKGCS